MDALTIEALEFLMESPKFKALYRLDYPRLPWVVAYEPCTRGMSETREHISLVAALQEAMRATGWKSEKLP